MLEQYDTSSVLAHNRLAYYYDVICRMYCHVNLSVTSDIGTQFDARVVQKQIASLGVGEIAAPGVLYTRDTNEINRNPCDDFFASLLLEGSAHLEQCGRQVIQNVGDIILYDIARSFAYHFSSNYRLVLLKIPRKQLLCRLHDAERLTAFALDGRTSMGALAGSVIRSTANVDADLDSSAASKLAASVTDILAAAFETEFRGIRGMSVRHSNILERAKNYIQANLGDAELDVDRVSNGIGVSSRTLNRIFASHGTTAARWMWQMRLEASHASLIEGRVQHVADVALQFGFSDFSHFSRAFKKTYGIAPGNLLKHGKFCELTMT